MSNNRGFTGTTEEYLREVLESTTQADRQRSSVGLAERDEKVALDRLQGHLWCVISPYFAPEWKTSNVEVQPCSGRFLLDGAPPTVFLTVELTPYNSVAGDWKVQRYGEVATAEQLGEFLVSTKKTLNEFIVKLTTVKS